jgi:hypothetical protein
VNHGRMKLVQFTPKVPHDCRIVYGNRSLHRDWFYVTGRVAATSAVLLQPACILALRSFPVRSRINRYVINKLGWAFNSGTRKQPWRGVCALLRGAQATHESARKHNFVDYFFSANVNPEARSALYVARPAHQEAGPGSS